METYKIEINEEQRKVLAKALRHLCFRDQITDELLVDLLNLPMDQATDPNKVIAFCE